MMDGGERKSPRDFDRNCDRDLDRFAVACSRNSDASTVNALSTISRESKSNSLKR